MRQMIESFIKQTEPSLSLKNSAMQTPEASQGKRFFSSDYRSPVERTPKLNISHIMNEQSRETFRYPMDSFRSSSAVTTRCYDFEDFSCTAKLSGHCNSVNKLAMTGNVLWSAGSDYTICKWRVSPRISQSYSDILMAQSPVISLKAHSRRITALSCVDYSLLSSGGQDGKLKLWDNDLNFQGSVDAHSGSVKGLSAISPYSLLSCGSEGLIKVWDPESLSKATTVYDFHQGSVNCLEVRSENTFFSGGSDLLLCLWDCRTARPMRKFEDFKAEIEAVLLWDECCVMTGGQETCIKVSLISRSGTSAPGVSSTLSSPLTLSTLWRSQGISS